jgi:4'-phosphopantetheinyl transferase
MQPDIGSSVPHHALGERQIDLWYVSSHGITDPGLLDEYRSCLPADEMAQEQRFAFAESRVQHLVSRVLVRSVLSHYTGDDLRTWTFVRNPYGKPTIAAAAGLPIEFNLSHTRGLVCCAVALGSPVGVDAEQLAEISDCLDLAKRFFAPAEAGFLERVAAAERSNVFLRIWTLKEAFVKARGLGLSLPLDGFAFSLAPDRPPRVSLADVYELDPGQWQFAEVRVAGRYQIALAVEASSSLPLAVRVRQTLPLRWATEGRLLSGSRSNQWSL